MTESRRDKLAREMSHGPSAQDRLYAEEFSRPNIKNRFSSNIETARNELARQNAGQDWGDMGSGALAAIRNWPRDVGALASAGMRAMAPYPVRALIPEVKTSKTAPFLNERGGFNPEGVAQLGTTLLNPLFFPEGLARGVGMAGRGLQRGITALERGRTPLYVTQEAAAPGFLQHTAHLPELSLRRIAAAQRAVGGELGAAERLPTAGGFWRDPETGVAETNPMFALPLKGRITPEMRGEIGTLGRLLDQQAQAAHRFIPLRVPGTKSMANAAELSGVTPEEVAQLAPLADDAGLAFASRPGGRGWLAPYSGEAADLQTGLNQLAKEYGLTSGRYRLGMSYPELDHLYIKAKDYPQIPLSADVGELRDYDAMLRAAGY